MYKRVVIKIGTNVITQNNGLLDLEILGNLIKQVSQLKKNGIEVILVSSGAMGAGRSLVKLDAKTNAVIKRQVLASVGQPKLINTYSELFSKYSYVCAQILATKEDFRDRLHYLNMKNCFLGLLQDNIIPIVNENDVVSVTELMFTDNDELAGLIASMMGANALIVLTNVDGIFNGDPKDPSSKVIHKIYETKDIKSFISTEKSEFGRGGMLTKCAIGNKVSKVGITMHIANGKTANILLDILTNKEVGTTFIPTKDASGIKRWIAYSQGYEKGIIYINEGAEKALSNHLKATSILPIGVIKITGEFKKGDIVKLCNEKEESIGLGVVQYTSEKAKNLIGQKNQKPLIHYDYLFLN